jgi:hypothetical protein
MKITLVIVAGALSTFASSLFAQNTTLVKNIDEKGRAPYTASARCTTGVGFSGCTAVFPNVPSGKRLVLEYVNVDIAAASFPALSLSSSSGPSFTVPVFGPRFFNDYGASAQVLMYINAGQHAMVGIIGQQVNSASITGYLVDLTK